MAPPKPRSHLTRRGLGCLTLALLLVVGAAIAGFALLRDRGVTAPVPGQQRCVATAGESSVVLSLEQAHLTSIIVGLSVRRGLAPRAASIAMATVYQESGIRNLDGGDRDSVGLFQQRPSQGWGTVKQLKDPYYATGAFYDALVKVKGWEDGDITEVAQQVQRSGFPDAYRDHEADGRVLASVLTGRSTAGISCLERQDRAGNSDGLVTAMEKTLGTVDHAVDGPTVTVRAGKATLAWAYGQHAVANAARYGVVSVTVADRTWTSDGTTLAAWEVNRTMLGTGEVRVTLR
ncbi:hypothetical protein [uncultured Friedmanniella sp.]|uniref:hypothetical protein n=1 Tax=uncultured Friedmanniella sp. TaxID=335381 RepID=UPI0035CB2BB1